MQQKAAKYLTALVYAAAIVGGLWLAFRFILPWTAPFLLAFSAAALLETPVRALVRRGWSRSVASGLLTVGLLGTLAYIAVALTLKGVECATRFAREVPELMNSALEGIHALEAYTSAYAASAPEGVAVYIKTALEAFTAGLYDLPGRLSACALDLAARAAQETPNALLFVVTAGIGSYFISASFPRVTGFLSMQLPEGLHRHMEGVGQNLRASFGGLLRAQLILTAMTFCELLPAFLALGIDGAPAIAAATAAIDALPIFGTGIILVPWAVYCLLLGDIRRAFGLILCWGVVSLVRNCAQAKLLGDQIGLDPVASLLAVYVGWKVWGVCGMLLFPVLLVTLRQLNDRGVIRLWKS